MFTTRILRLTIRGTIYSNSVVSYGRRCFIYQTCRTPIVTFFHPIIDQVRYERYHFVSIRSNIERSLFPSYLVRAIRQISAYFCPIIVNYFQCLCVIIIGRYRLPFCECIVRVFVCRRYHCGIKAYVPFFGEFQSVERLQDCRVAIFTMSVPISFRFTRLSQCRMRPMT